MNDTSIVVENISKQYYIGRGMQQTSQESTALRWLQAPLRRMRQMWSTNMPEFADETFWALKDVSFEVKRGEVLGIIGHNGAGKSTLLKILTRITKPTSGHARIYGRVGSLLEVGTGFHPELTGRENVYLNGVILGMSRREIDALFDEIVDFAGVEQFLDTPVKRYSSGMRVRLAFSVAAHLLAEILLVDEVLSVGDLAFQKKSLGKIGGLTDSGRTVLFVSHNLLAVQQLCSRILYLENGLVKALGHTETVIQKYLKDSVPQSNITLDLSTVSRSQDDLGRDIIIRKCHLVDSINQPQAVIRIGETLLFLIEIISHLDIENLQVALRIENITGVHICTVVSQYQGILYSFQEGEVKQILLRLDELNLAPGMYYVSVSVRHGGTKHYDLLDKQIHFEVGSAKVDKVDSEHSYPNGIVVPRVRWESLVSNIP